MPQTPCTRRPRASSDWPSLILSRRAVSVLYTEPVLLLAACMPEGSKARNGPPRKASRCLLDAPVVQRTGRLSHRVSNYLAIRVEVNAVGENKSGAGAVQLGQDGSGPAETSSISAASGTLTWTPWMQSSFVSGFSDLGERRAVC